MNDRITLHIKLDCFYASIEQRDNEELQGKMMAVGDEDRKRGSIAAVSREAKKYGVRDAMATYSAKKKCPRLIIVPARLSVYKEVAAQIKQILYRYTNVVETVGRDEFFLDVTDNDLDVKKAITLAKRLKEDILEATQLTASVGVANNKFLAVIASEMHFPDGLTAVLPNQAQAFIDDLPIDKFIGVGRANAKKMHRLRIRHGADIRKINRGDLIREFGQNGVFYYEICRGIDPRPVQDDSREFIEVHQSYETPIKEEQKILESLSDLHQKLVELKTSKNFEEDKLILRVRLKSMRTIVTEINNVVLKPTKKMFSEISKLYKSLENDKSVQRIQLELHSK